MVYSDGSTVTTGGIIRKGFALHHRKITNGKEFRASIRAGGFTWPGGYPIAWITSDGGALCHTCAKNEAFQVLYSIRHGINDGWRATGLSVEYEGFYCDHCNEDK